MKIKFLVGSLFVFNLLLQGCYILEDDSDEIDNQMKEDAKRDALVQKRLEDARRDEILRGRAIIIEDSGIEERDVDMNGLISALSTDGTNIFILSDGGSIYKYNPDEYSTEYVFNIKNSLADDENYIDLRKAFFFYLFENIFTVGYYTNQLVDINSSHPRHKYIERKYYRDGKFLEELEEPIVKQNLAKPGYSYQYRVDRTSIWREPQSSGNENGGGSGDDGKEIFRKSIDSTGSKNVGWSGLTIIHDYVWVGSSSTHSIFKIKKKIRDAVDEQLEDYNNSLIK